ncbi:voltage-gated purine nucleotide uniporter SLC17A9 isoform X3 [Ovis canadensis]|uniref:voltage-gated purine nucleotide uniporter SLC17A9 isoform X3 n=1 Tax=Ovis canadensis TaxID=37174 RepID=UPI003753B7B6
MQPSPDETRRDAAEDTQWSRPECQVWTGTLLLGTCLLYCARVSMPVCAASMSQDFGWNKKEAGVVLSSFFWGYCLTQVVGGHLGDRIGGEKVILLSASAWGFITVATPLLAHLGSAHLAFMTFSRILTGLLQGVYFPALTSLLSQKVRESERAFTYSTVGAGSQFGTLVTGAVGSLLLDWYGWPSVFYFSGGLTLLWVGYVYRCLLNERGKCCRSQALAERVYSPYAQSGAHKLPPASGLWEQVHPPTWMAFTWACLPLQISSWPWASWHKACPCPDTPRCPGDSSSESLLSGQPSSPSSQRPAPSSSSSPGCRPSLRRPSPAPRAGSSTWCPGWWPFPPVCSAGFSPTISSIRPCRVGPFRIPSGVGQHRWPAGRSGLPLSRLQDHHRSEVHAGRKVLRPLSPDSLPLSPCFAPGAPDLEGG